MITVRASKGMAVQIIATGEVWDVIASSGFGIRAKSRTTGKIQGFYGNVSSDRARIVS